MWKIGDDTFDLNRRGWIMGVLNVTPDSFSDGGRYFNHDAAVMHARSMLAQGADVIDVGGESTRPGSLPVTAAEEKSRVLPVISELARENGVLISIDTSKAEVARAALDAGARIVNDVSGGRADPAMWPLLRERQAGYIVMHMQGTPRTMQHAPVYHDVVSEVADFFRQRYACALTCGIDPMRLAFDPGIGFGKTPAHNLALLRHLPELRMVDRPLVLGVSRKSFLTKIVENGSARSRTSDTRSGDEQTTSSGQHLAPTIAFTSLLRASGADVLRVHDVKENLEALRVAEAWREMA